MTKSTKKIKNTINKQSNVKNTIKIEEIKSYLYKKQNALFDFSYPYALCSGKTNQFNNYLQNLDDFTEKLKDIILNINKLSASTLESLIIKGEFRHCHKIDDKHQAVAKTAIKEIIRKHRPHDSDVYYSQNIEDEDLYQTGLETGIRLVGIIDGNVFKIFLIDFYHDLYSDERQNSRSKSSHHFSFSMQTI